MSRSVVQDPPYNVCKLLLYIYHIIIFNIIIYHHYCPKMSWHSVSPASRLKTLERCREGRHEDIIFLVHPRKLTWNLKITPLEYEKHLIYEPHPFLGSMLETSNRPHQGTRSALPNLVSAASSGGAEILQVAPNHQHDLSPGVNEKMSGRESGIGIHLTNFIWQSHVEMHESWRRYYLPWVPCGTIAMNCLCLFQPSSFVQPVRKEEARALHWWMATHPRHSVTWILIRVARRTNEAFSLSKHGHFLW